MITKKEYLNALDIVETYHKQIRKTGKMPPLSDFKRRRESIKLSMQQVANKVGVSKSTISRLERGEEVYYTFAKAINDFYVENEV